MLHVDASHSQDESAPSLATATFHPATAKTSLRMLRKSEGTPGDGQQAGGGPVEGGPVTRPKGSPIFGGPYGAIPFPTPLLSKL